MHASPVSQPPSVMHSVQKIRPGRAMDRAVHAAAAAQTFVGGVHDSIDSERRDVGNGSACELSAPRQSFRRRSNSTKSRTLRRRDIGVADQLQQQPVGDQLRDACLHPHQHSVARAITLLRRRTRVAGSSSSRKAPRAGCGPPARPADRDRRSSRSACRAAPPPAAGGCRRVRCHRRRPWKPGRHRCRPASRSRGRARRASIQSTGVVTMLPPRPGG